MIRAQLTALWLLIVALCGVSGWLAYRVSELERGEFETLKADQILARRVEIRDSAESGGVTIVGGDRPSVILWDEDQRLVAGLTSDGGEKPSGELTLGCAGRTTAFFGQTPNGRARMELCDESGALRLFYNHSGLSMTPEDEDLGYTVHLQTNGGGLSMWRRGHEVLLLGTYQLQQVLSQLR